VVSVCALLAAGACLGGETRGGDDPAQCAELVSREDWRAAQRACTAQLELDGAPQTALSLAAALTQLGDHAGALEMARRALRDGPTAAALLAEGSALDRLHQTAPARASLHRALALAEQAGEAKELARIAYTLAGSFWRESDYQQVATWLDAADDALRAAEEHQDAAPKLRGHIAMMRGDAYREMGNLTNAERNYDVARSALAQHASTRAWVRLKQGKLFLERGELELAKIAFRAAGDQARAAGQHEVERASRLNLAEVAWLQGDTARGLELLSGWADERDDAYLRVLGVLTAASGDLPSGDLLLREAIDITRSDRLRWSLLYERGRIQEKLGNADEAERCYRASVDCIERMRASFDSSAERRATLPGRRRPYEALFRMHAQAGRHQRMLTVLETLGARSLLESIAADGDPRTASDTIRRANGLQAFAERLRELALHDGPEAELGVSEALVLAEADGRVWSVHQRLGDALVVEDAGSASEVRALAERLERDAGDLAAADALGAMLLGAIAPGDEVLYVVPIGDLLRIPWAALRREGRPLVVDRPVAVSPSLALLGREAQAPAAGSLVLGDPQGTLPRAREEATGVGGRLGVTPLLGARATRAALLTSPEPHLLHIASHASGNPEGSSLALADGPLTFTEIVIAGLHADIVVLSGCATAKPRSAEMWGSLAAAFLANGTGTVIATLGSVDDDSARAVIDAAYRHGLATDPVRALAAAQREMISASAPPDGWSKFVAYDVGARAP
jgi:tetratricopeptide (TPR) repeat protein